jgi:putative SOS response-associated peptidase YedK
MPPTTALEPTAGLSAYDEPRSAAIVTTTASEETRQIHDRMPVMLEATSMGLRSFERGSQEGSH